MEIALIFMGVLIFSSHIFNALFEKIRISNILILITIGLVIGPVFHLIGADFLGQAGRIFTTVTLISILYESGTGLKVDDLGKAIGGATLLTVINFVVSLAIAIAISHFLLGLELLPSAFLGAAVGGISSAVVIPMLQQLKLGSKANNVMFLESAISDVICLVGALAILDAMSSGVLDVKLILANMGKSLFFALIIGIVVGFIWMIVHRNILSGQKNSMFSSFALAFILYGGCELLGLNGGIAVLSYGIMVGNMGKFTLFLDKYLPTSKVINKREAFLKDNERNFYSEIVFVLQTYFFVYVGLSIKLDDMNLILVGALFMVLIFLARVPVVMMLGSKGFTSRDKKMMSILTPKGLIAAVLASLPLQKAITPQEIEVGETIQGVAYAGVLFSILLCSFFVFYFEKTNKEKPEEQAVVEESKMSGEQVVDQE